MNTSKERDRGLRSACACARLMMAAAVILLSAAQGVAGASSGWYLMKAPKKTTMRDWLPVEIRSYLIHGLQDYPSNDIEDYDFDAPLNRWTQRGEYESLRDCQNEVADWTTYIQQRLDEAWHLNERLTDQQRLAKYVKETYWIDLGFIGLSCVATDDPRLAR